MKALYFIMPLLIANACKTQDTKTISTNDTNMEVTENNHNSCPDGGTCTIEILEDKTLEIKEDGIGALYPEIKNGDNIVVQYTYSKQGPDGTVDGNYSETIHFEIPSSATNLGKQGASLQDVKLLYGKQCYCKGEAGYYKVSDGKLSLEKNNRQITFDLQFQVGKTSQVVTHISENARIKD